MAWRGHEKGAERFSEAADALFRRHTSYITLWAASRDNLEKRSGQEVKFLVSLLQDWLQKELDSKDFQKNEIKFRLIGPWQSIIPGNDRLERTIQKLEKETKKFKKRHLTILFGYDGQSEMIDAVKKIKNSPKTKISGRSLEKALLTGELPLVDLVIRTGGEPHWSAGFMMWQTANSQLYFTETLWPEFGKKELESALEDFSKRDRRFGR